MNAPERPVWFVGDLDDPWVTSIAEVLTGDVTRVACAEEWPEGLAQRLPATATLIVHRQDLTSLDVDFLEQLKKEREPAARVILCVGPYARSMVLGRCSAVVDAILPEAIARDVLPRHLAMGEGRGEGVSPSLRPPLYIVSGNFELRHVLADACASAGYRASTAADWLEVNPGGLAVWDVPVLESGWPEVMARRARVGTVVALLGFADRALVQQARASGASACLELPCDPADLFFVLDRLANSRAERGHEVPPPPVSLRRAARSVADAGRGAYNGTS